MTHQRKQAIANHAIAGVHFYAHTPTGVCEGTIVLPNVGLELGHEQRVEAVHLHVLIVHSALEDLLLRGEHLPEAHQRTRLETKEH